nr:MAG TPA: hypothetical protein [Caudoviricetes sp.]
MFRQVKVWYYKIRNFRKAFSRWLGAFYNCALNNLSRK